MEKIFEKIDSFRSGETDQHYRKDLSPVYENEYIKLVRIDSSNRFGGKEVICGKQWSILFELKQSFSSLAGWKKLQNYYRDDIRITPVKSGALAGCYGIRFYRMASNPTDQIIVDILNFIFA